MIRVAPLLLALASLAFADPPAAPATPAAPAPKPRTVRLFMRDGLRFEPARLEARPGELLSLDLENGDTADMAHNFLLLAPGARDAVVASALALAADGPARDYIPADPAILLSTRLLETGRTTTVKFRVPDAPGVYPYVCTFPGHGVMMYGALYAGVTPPPLADDKNLPPNSARTVLAGGGRRPFVQRIFMPDAGPAAIAVALAGSQNFCWDAGECRLRYAWQGAFLDPSENWAGNGRELPRLSAKPWWRASLGAENFPLRFGRADAPAPVVKFLGYVLTPAGPVFRYRADGVEIFEQLAPAPGAPGLALRFRLPRASGPVFFRARVDTLAKFSSPAGPFAAGILTLTPAQAADFSVILSSALCTP